MKTIVVIPARLESTRLPEKVLAKINGRSMLEHVHAAAIAANVGPVFVAVNHLSLVQEVRRFGGNAIMTGEHESGTDRIGEALLGMDENFDIVVNLQADMPNITPRAIQLAVALIGFAQCDIGTLVCRNTIDIEKTSVVKVTGTPIFRDSTNVINVTSFSRHIWTSTTTYKHIGIYVYTQHALELFLAHPPTLPEREHKLEQLRAMHLNLKITAAIIDESPISVDTPEDLERARAIMKESQ